MTPCFTSSATSWDHWRRSWRLVILATGWTPVDTILSVLVALLILSTAWSLVRDAAHVLLQGAPRNLDRDVTAGDLREKVAGVREIRHMHV